MPTYKKGSEKKHFPSVIAALVVLSAAIGFFIYSLITQFEKPILEELLIGDDGVSPSGNGPFPTEPPNIPEPTSPPPG
jgi:hypothetical protein